jgi:two-component system, NarL family, sensor histidine kinase UhpB
LRLRWMPEFLLQGLALLPWGWLLAFVFNLVMLVIYLDLQPRPGFMNLLLLLLLQLMLLVGVTLRFLVTLSAAEKQKRDLKAQVAVSLRQLERAQATARQAEQQQALSEVKRRIFSELHEDVGSKLLSIAHAGRNTRLGGLASSALENLRDAVSRANSSEVGIGQFLVTLQEEMVLRLSGLGIVLQWNQPARFDEWTLSPDQHYQLARIFRELVNNIIRHANATQVDFSASTEQAAWQFRLADNGAGFEVTRPPGDGINAIRKWAAELGADTCWDSRPGAGLLFTLSLPALASRTAAKRIP